MLIETNTFDDEMIRKLESFKSLFCEVFDGKTEQWEDLTLDCSSSDITISDADAELKPAAMVPM